MKLLHLILATLFSLTLVTSASAEKLSLAEISAYLNAMQTAQAEFTQINDDGTISTGQMFIRRPGRVRFEYDPPEESLVMAGGGQVAVFDAKSNQPPERFPLTKTPLNLILARNINLDRAKMVVGHTADATTTSVIAQDPQHPEYGSIQLVFTGAPVELRQWVITDGADQKTTVVLGELKKGGRLNLSMFNIRSEMTRRGF